MCIRSFEAFNEKVIHILKSKMLEVDVNHHLVKMEVDGDTADHAEVV